MQTHLSDGLYNVKDGKIYKYKAKGGTVRTYDIRNIVRCKDCKYWVSDGGALMICDIHKDPTVPDHYCSYGEEDKDEQAWKGAETYEFISHWQTEREGE